MTEIARRSVADQGQRRASFVQARSHATKQSLVQAALALWRANGYARTTVADICRAAGVSKALFYFYFPRKEDVLFEVGVLSTEIEVEQRLRHTRRPADVGDGRAGVAVRAPQRRCGLHKGLFCRVRASLLKRGPALTLVSN